MRKEIFNRTFGRASGDGDIAVMTKGYSNNNTRDYQTDIFLNDQHLFNTNIIKTLLTNNVLIVERVGAPTQTWNRSNYNWEYYSLEESTFIEDEEDENKGAIIMRLRIRRGLGTNDPYVPNEATELRTEALDRTSTYNATKADRRLHRIETQTIAAFFLDSHRDTMIEGGEVMLIAYIDSIKNLNISGDSVSRNFQRYQYLEPGEIIESGTVATIKNNAFGGKYNSCQRGKFRLSNRDSKAIHYIITRRVDNNLLDWTLDDVKKLLLMKKIKSMKRESYFLDAYCASTYEGFEDIVHINDEYGLIKLDDDVQQGSGGDTLDELLKVNPDGGYSLSIVSTIEITEDGSTYMEIPSGNYRVVSKATVSSLLDYRQNIPSTFGKILVSGIKHRYAAMFIIDEEEEEEDVSVNITPTLQEAVNAEEEEDISIGSDWLNRLK